MRVASDAVVEHEASLIGEFGAGQNADADNDKVNVQFSPACQKGTGHAPVLALYPLQSVALPDVYPVTLVQGSEEVRSLFAGDTFKDAIRHLNQGHLQAKFRRHGRGLKPDVATSNDQSTLSCLHLRRHCFYVSEGPNLVNARKPVCADACW